MSDKKLKKSDYGADSIQHLEGRDAVRKRPGMYIGDTEDGSGLHHLIWEIVDNSVDEAQEGHCDTIVVALLPGDYISVRDNGRGIPVGVPKDSKTGKSAAELVMTELHAGGKFNQNAYGSSGGLHGVGASVVNFLSESVKLEIWREGYRWEQNYKQGRPEGPVSKMEKAKGKSGTKITFKADKEIFPSVTFDLKKVAERLQIVSFLNKGLKIILRDRRGEKPLEKVYHNQVGLKEFLQFKLKGKAMVHDKVVSFETTSPVKVGSKYLKAEVALAWTNKDSTDESFYTNNIPNKDGGTHQHGFRSSLTRVCKKFAEDILPKKNKTEIQGTDCLEGLVVLYSLKLPDPKFSSQTKEKLVSSEARGFSETLVGEEIAKFFEENPKEAKKILERMATAAQAREAARKAKEAIRNKNGLDLLTNKGKLADCSWKDPALCEMWLVEGNSAAGCIFEDTNVSLKERGSVKIKDVNIGDEVLTHNGLYKKVLDKSITNKSNRIRILYEDMELICSDDHPILIRRNDELIWVSAGDIREDDSLCKIKKISS